MAANRTITVPIPPIIRYYDASGRLVGEGGASPSGYSVHAAASVRAGPAAGSIILPRRHRSSGGAKGGGTDTLSMPKKRGMISGAECDEDGRYCPVAHEHPVLAAAAAGNRAVLIYFLGLFGYDYAARTVTTSYAYDGRDPSRAVLDPADDSSSSSLSSLSSPSQSSDALDDGTRDDTADVSRDNNNKHIGGGKVFDAETFADFKQLRLTARCLLSLVGAEDYWGRGPIDGCGRRGARGTMALLLTCALDAQRALVAAEDYIIAYRSHRRHVVVDSSKRHRKSQDERESNTMVPETAGGKSAKTNAERRRVRRENRLAYGLGLPKPSGGSGTGSDVKHVLPGDEQYVDVIATADGSDALPPPMPLVRALRVACAEGSLQRVRTISCMWDIIHALDARGGQQRGVHHKKDDGGGGGGCDLGSLVSGCVQCLSSGDVASRIDGFDWNAARAVKLKTYDFSHHQTVSPPSRGSPHGSMRFQQSLSPSSPTVHHPSPHSLQETAAAADHTASVMKRHSFSSFPFSPEAMLAGLSPTSATPFGFLLLPFRPPSTPSPATLRLFSAPDPKAYYKTALLEAILETPTSTMCSFGSLQRDGSGLGGGYGGGSVFIDASDVTHAFESAEARRRELDDLSSLSDGSGGTPTPTNLWGVHHRDQQQDGRRSQQNGSHHHHVDAFDLIFFGGPPAAPLTAATTNAPQRQQQRVVTAQGANSSASAAAIARPPSPRRFYSHELPTPFLTALVRGANSPRQRRQDAEGSTRQQCNGRGRLGGSSSPPFASTWGGGSSGGRAAPLGGIGHHCWGWVVSPRMPAPPPPLRSPLSSPHRSPLLRRRQ